MIETTIPEIDVADLMQRVRAEARRAKHLSGVRADSSDGNVPPLPEVARLPAAPSVWIPSGVSSNKERLDSLIQTARAKTEVSSRIPKFLRRFFRKQGGYNRAILDSLGSLSKTNHNLTRRIGEIAACLEQLTGWILSLHRQREADAGWMNAINSAVPKIYAFEDRAAQLALELQSAQAALAGQQDELHEQISRLEKEHALSGANIAGELDLVRRQLEETTLQVNNVRLEANTVSARTRELQSQHNGMGEHLRSIHRQTEKTGTDVDNLRVEFQRAKASAEAAQKIVETQIDQAALHLGDLQAQTGAHGTHLQNLQALTGEHGTHLKNLQALTDHHGTHLQNLQAQTDDYGTHLQNLQAQTDDHGAHLQNLQAQTDHHGTHLQNLQTQTDDHGTHLNNLEGESANIRSSLKELCKTLQGQIDSAAVHLGNLQGVSEALGVHLRGLQTQADGLGVHLRNLQAQSDGFEVNLDKLQGFVDKHAAETSASLGGFEQHLKDQADLPQKISNIEERNTIESAFVKGELSEYGSLFRRLLGDDLKEGTPARGKGRRPNGPEAKATRRFDSFYLSFENRFRGSREEIKKRVSFYLPFLQKARAGASARPILDLGCGRGEWLELLKDHKLKGRGVDMNSTMTAHCQARGLTVLQGDAIEFLRTLRSNSQGGITGFHIIEHLPFETVMELFRESRRVLKPGGIAIFESPNCKNLTVGACNFYVDPTHRNPVFPETAEFMLASHGFENIKIEYLSPVANPPFEATSAEFATIKDLLYGPQDFGIIAYKSKKR